MMQYLHFFIRMLMFLGGCCLCVTSDCQFNKSGQKEVAYTITVDQTGKGNFTTVQSAIDSIPDNNNQWIRVQISPGRYWEKVVIPVHKPCIFLQGTDSNVTSIEFDDQSEKYNSATFYSYADYTIAKGITFKNLPAGASEDKLIWKRANAAKIQGDKSAFYQCSFIGIQDTVYDNKGLHYFWQCYFEGAIDFIYGDAKSIYEECEIFVMREKYEPGLASVITAQQKEDPEDASGFVFKNCLFTGIGKAQFGRAWGPYSTVIIYNSTLTNIIVPTGWDAWDYAGHEANFTYVEAYNTGPGADTSQRVPWLKKLSGPELSAFVNISYINEDGWLSGLPSFS